MTYPLSRMMSLATAGYASYALVEPRHLGRFLVTGKKEQRAYDSVAMTYGARDLAISSVGLLARSERAISAAMVIRILSDIGDGLLLASRVDDDETRAEVLAVTFGWAGLNLVALRRDRRAARKKGRLV